MNKSLTAWRPRLQPWRKMRHSSTVHSFSGKGMVIDMARVQRRRLLFFLVLVVTIAPIFLFPLLGRFSHEIKGTPRVQNGVLDLERYDFSHRNVIYLDGEWEFFWDKWIVSDARPDAQPDMMIKVPDQWSGYAIGEERPPDAGIASYRILLKNCPAEVGLASYVPNLGASYRVYLDGKLVSESGIPTKDAGDRNISLSLIQRRLSLPTGRDMELVVEVASNRAGGLYMSPILAENMNDYLYSRLRYAIASAYIGILLITIGCYAYILFIGDKTVSSLALLALDVVMFLRILSKDEFFSILKAFAPFFRYHATNAVLQILSLFLPVIFLLCARDLVELQLSRRTLLHVVLYEMVFVFPMFYCIMRGLLREQYYLCLLSFVPFVFILRQMYQGVVKGTPYMLTVFIGMTLTISSLIVSTQYATGRLNVNVSMYPPTCFVLASLLQDYMYIRKNNDMRRDALEAAHLRLRLRESETALMLSQIKPHFLYNALIAIQVLCTREPETAEEAVIKFAKYLRANMQSIGSREPIPFVQELEHIRNYVSIEKLRFKERLHVLYEIGADDFCVPPLTLQPLVENAIKHGACKRIMGGTVTLRTWEEADSYQIQVLDDGVGFDTAVLLQDRPKSFGLRNISLRLREMIDARIDIRSTPGQGTDVRIAIPKKSAHPPEEGAETP